MIQEMSLPCIHCSYLLQIPSDSKSLDITCPSCGSTWHWGNLFDEYLQNKEENKWAKIPGQAFGAMGSAANFADNVIFNASRGHGFAAEKANHLYDVFTGKDAKLVGGDNQKNGADRLVDGVQIQTKYCSSGGKCVSEAFDNGQYRYWNPDGSPMQLEVPSDKYDAAVQALEERIKKN
jgi:hypothetical protein